MSVKSTNEPEGLRVILVQALQAYELARATHLQTTDLAKAEQERVSHLLTFIEQVKHASRDLLEKAGLAYIAGSPLQLNETAAPARNNDKVVAAAFSEAQLAYIDLRTALFQLATAFLDSKCWEQARRIVQPLLEDKKVPLYTDACNLLYESHYQAALSARQAKDISGTIWELHQLASLNIRYKKTIQMLEDIFVQEELFAHLSNEDVWDLIAQIFLVLQVIKGTNLSMRQRLATSPEFQAAMKAITAIEPLWSTNVKVAWKIGHNEANLHITYLSFSTSSKLIAVGFEAGWNYGSYNSEGITVFDVQSGQEIFRHKIYEDQPSRDPTQSLFFEEDEFLHVHSTRTKLRLNLTTGKQEPSSNAQKQLDHSSAIGSLLLSNIKRKVGKATIVAQQMSPNGLYVAVAVGKKLYMFRKSASSRMTVGNQAEPIDDSSEEVLNE